MPTYVLLSTHAMTEKEEPVVVVEADSVDSIPTSVRPYDPDNPKHQDRASDVEWVIQDGAEPEHCTVSYLAHSFGGYREGSQ